MTALDRAIETVLELLAVEAEENVVVLSDPERRTLGLALAEGARARRAEAVLVEMSERESHGSEPPDPAAAAMARADVLICPTTKSVTHTEARREASARGARAATMGGVTEDMLVRTMSADYDAIARRSEAVAGYLTRGSEVRISTERGTDLRFSIEGREGIADTGDLSEPGSYGNLPAGEGFVAPVEGSARGRVLFDGSIWPIGKLDEPIEVTFEDGYATAIEGPRAAEFRAVLEPHGSEAFALAELGIGTNEAAALTGNVLEDEKILGTIHLAVGSNFAFGGRIRVASHQDGVVLGPTVTIDGDVILDAGRLVPQLENPS